MSLLLFRWHSASSSRSPHGGPRVRLSESSARRFPCRVTEMLRCLVLCSRTSRKPGAGEHLWARFPGGALGPSLRRSHPVLRDEAHIPSAAQASQKPSTMKEKGNKKSTERDSGSSEAHLLRCEKLREPPGAEVSACTALAAPAASTFGTEPPGTLQSAGRGVLRPPSTGAERPKRSSGAPRSRAPSSSPPPHRESSSQFNGQTPGPIRLTGGVI